MKQAYTQCRLQRRNQHGYTTQTAWIPSQFARVGRIISIKGVDGWRVMSIGATLPAEYVREHERDYWGAFPSLK